MDDQKNVGGGNGDSDDGADLCAILFQVGILVVVFVLFRVTVLLMLLKAIPLHFLMTFVRLKNLGNT